MGRLNQFWPHMELHARIGLRHDLFGWLDGMEVHLVSARGYPEDGEQCYGETDLMSPHVRYLAFRIRRCRPLNFRCRSGDKQLTSRAYRIAAELLPAGEANPDPGSSSRPAVSAGSSSWWIGHPNIIIPWVKFPGEMDT